MGSSCQNGALALLPDSTGRLPSPSLKGWLGGGGGGPRWSARRAYLFPVALAAVLLVAGVAIYGLWIPKEADSESWRQTLPFLAMVYGTLILLAVAILETRFHHIRQKDILHRQRVLSEMFDYLARQRDEERQEISEVLHSNLGGLLTAAKMLLEDVASRDKITAGEAAQLDELLGQALAEARGMAAVLYPRAMLRMGLKAALQEVVGRFKDVAGAPAIALEVAPEAHALSCRVGLCAVALVQEFFVNVVRHAQASQVRIVLACEEGALRGRVEDNGRGISPNACGMGLMLCEERVRLLGGSFTIETSPQGTTVDFTLPINGRADKP